MDSCDEEDVGGDAFCPRKALNYGYICVFLWMWKVVAGGAFTYIIRKVDEYYKTKLTYNTIMNQRRLLLISNSASPGEKYLERPAEDIANFFGEAKDDVVLIPYAAVTYSFDEYVDKVNRALEHLGVRVRGVHQCSDPREAIRSAKGIFVGGGNTWQLLNMMQEQGLVEVIREGVMAGKPYAGWSAGSNVACPTIMTTNDMPIVQPRTMNALGLVPFQINPHYLDAHPSDHGGETREMRIQEFTIANPHTYVAGLREGCRFVVEGDRMTLRGEKPVRLFKHGEAIREVPREEDFSFLLRS